MSNKIKQIIYVLSVIVAVTGLATGSANAQLNPSVNIEVEDADVCVSGTYLVNPEDRGSFYQCVNGVPVLVECPAGLVFNADITVCEEP